MTTSVDQTTPDITEETCETASLTYGLSEENEDSFRQFHEL